MLVQIYMGSWSMLLKLWARCPCEIFQLADTGVKPDDCRWWLVVFIILLSPAAMWF